MYIATVIADVLALSYWMAAADLEGRCRRIVTPLTPQQSVVFVFPLMWLRPIILPIGSLFFLQSSLKGFHYFLQDQHVSV